MTKLHLNPRGLILRVVAESMLQIIMDADVEGLIGAGRHERSSDRTPGWALST